MVSKDRRNPPSEDALDYNPVSIVVGRSYTTTSNAHDIAVVPLLGSKNVEPGFKNYSPKEHPQEFLACRIYTEKHTTKAVFMLV